MKSFFKTLGLIIFAQISIGLVILTGLSYHPFLQVSLLDAFSKEFEISTYLVLAVLGIIVFTKYLKISKTIAGKLIVNAVVSLFYTAQVFLLNNVFTSLEWMGLFSYWEDNVPFIDVILHDLSHTENFLFLKYPFVFVFMFGVLAVVAFFPRKVISFFKKKIDGLFLIDDSDEEQEDVASDL